MDREIAKNRGIKLKHIIWAVAIVLFIIAARIIYNSGKEEVYKTSREKITISTVEEGFFSDYITVIGKVEPITTIYLDAIEGGRVVERLIDEGATVKKGDVILKLENRQLYQTILNSEAALAEKENYLRNTRINFEAELIQSRKNLLENSWNLKRKERQYKQNKQLFEQGLISKEEFLQSEEDYEFQAQMLKINKQKAITDSLIRVTSMQTLEADLKTMRQVLTLVRERLDNLNVKAPIDGQLGMLDAEVGQSISQGQSIGQIHVLTNYKVTALIEEHHVDKVFRGLEARLERNEKEYLLKVKKVLPEVRNGFFEVELVFEGDRPEKIRTGQTYHIRLELGMPEKALLVQRGGFYQSTAGQWAFVLNENGTEAEKRSIRIGQKNPGYYTITEGLKPGDKIITSSYDLYLKKEKIILK
jgi:HlyD family secretion protein